MSARPRLARLVDWLWLIGCGLIGSALIVSASEELGVTFDESFYLNAGLKRWRTGSTFDLMAAGTMPLPVDVQTLPVYVAERWRARPWDLGTEFHQALAIARCATLLFWWLVLIYGWRIAAGIGGRWAGRLAVTFLALEPTLLAHSGLATTDVALTACVLMFAHHYGMGREGGWLRRVGLPALLYGLAILAKASGLVFVPLCMVAIELERRRPNGFREAIRALLSRAYLRESLVIASLAILMTYLYCGCDWKSHPKVVAAAQALPDGPCREPAIWLAEHFRIFNNAGVGLWYQIKHNMSGHGAYLLGESASRAIWYYFPVALSIKLPAALLLTPIVLLFLVPRCLCNWPNLAALLLLLFSLNCRVQIGVRMQLPLIAFLAVGLSAAVARGATASSITVRRLVFAWACVSLLLMSAAALRTWPHHLTYVNEFWGGPKHGERLLSDSNFDWGQGLPELARWAQSQEQPIIAVWYFGTDPAVTRAPFRLVPLHTLAVANDEQLRSVAGARYLAVSTTLTHGSYIDRSGWLMRKLRSSTPTARTRTFLIFDLELNPVAGQAESGAGSGPSNSSKTPIRRNFW